MLAMENDGASVIVPVADAVEIVAPLVGALSVTVNVSDPSMTLSFMIETAKVLVTSLGEKLNVPEAAVKSVPLVAVPLEVA
jgi:hypothetical protein